MDRIYIIEGADRALHRLRKAAPDRDHIIAMTGGDRVSVIPHRRERINRIPASCRDFSESISECSPLRVVVPDRFILETLVHLTIKSAEFLTQWL